MFWTHQIFAQSTEVSFEFSSGFVAPFEGHWETPQLNIENGRIRIFCGFDYVRYDKVPVKNLESQKYAAWMNSGFFGVGYILRKSDFEFIPHAAFFAGTGFVKVKNELNQNSCSSCLTNNSSATYYSGREYFGLRLGGSVLYALSNDIKAGVSMVFYPLIQLSYNDRPHKPGALQLSLSYTFFHQ